MEATLEMAKVTAKGQITVPVAIRSRLGIKPGDKVLFASNANGEITVHNAMIEAFAQAQAAFSGAAAEAGLEGEQDVVDFVKAVRRERAGA